MPTPPGNQTMTEEEVENLRRGLALLAQPNVEEQYRTNLARLVSEKLPTPRMVQQFLVVWKYLWKQKWR
jgi:hypothetical protein